MSETINEYILNRLSKVSIFNELTNQEINEFAKIIKLENFKPQEIIIKEGDLGDKFYVIIHGDVEILKKTMYGDQYTCDILLEESHTFFGEFSLLDHDVRSATVRSVNQVEAIAVKRNDFEDFCEKNMVIGYKLMKSIAKRLCGRLRKADKEIVVLFEALVDEIGDKK